MSIVRAEGEDHGRKSRPHREQSQQRQAEIASRRETALPLTDSQQQQLQDFSISYVRKLRVPITANGVQEAAEMLYLDALVKGITDEHPFSPKVRIEPFLRRGVEKRSTIRDDFTETVEQVRSEANTYSKAQALGPYALKRADIVQGQQKLAGLVLAVDISALETVTKQKDARKQLLTQFADPFLQYLHEHVSAKTNADIFTTDHERAAFFRNSVAGLILFGDATPLLNNKRVVTALQEMTPDTWKAALKARQIGAFLQYFSKYMAERTVDLAVRAQIAPYVLGLAQQTVFYLEGVINQQPLWQKQFENDQPSIYERSVNFLDTNAFILTNPNLEREKIMINPADYAPERHSLWAQDTSVVMQGKRVPNRDVLLHAGMQYPNNSNERQKLLKAADLWKEYAKRQANKTWTATNEQRKIAGLHEMLQDVEDGNYKNFMSKYRDTMSNSPVRELVLMHSAEKDALSRIASQRKIARPYKEFLDTCDGSRDIPSWYGEKKVRDRLLTIEATLQQSQSALAESRFILTFPYLEYVSFDMTPWRQKDETTAVRELRDYRKKEERAGGDGETFKRVLKTILDPNARKDLMRHIEITLGITAKHTEEAMSEDQRERRLHAKRVIYSQLLRKIEMIDDHTEDIGYARHVALSVYDTLMQEVTNAYKNMREAKQRIKSKEKEKGEVTNKGITMEGFLHDANYALIRDIPELPLDQLRDALNTFHTIDEHIFYGISLSPNPRETRAALLAKGISAKAVDEILSHPLFPQLATAMAGEQFMPALRAKKLQVEKIRSNLSFASKSTDEEFINTARKTARSVILRDIEEAQKQIAEKKDGTLDEKWLIEKFDDLGLLVTDSSRSNTV